MIPNNIIISDKGNFEKVLNSMKSGGAGSVHILSDFDRTMTYSKVGGEERPSLIGAMRKGLYLGEEYSKKAYGLYDYYHPIEIDPDILIGEKNKYMTERWNNHLKLLVESNLQKKHIEKVINSGIIKLRDGIDIFLSTLEKNYTPLIIISANGLGGDSIKLYLENHNLMKENIFIISNKFIWNENGFATGYEEPVIHVFNKDETVLKDFPEIHKKVENRKNVILLGDSLGDPHMIEGFEYDNLLKVGFLNEKEDGLLKYYEERYDVVITGDGDFSFVNYILDEILN